MTQENETEPVNQPVNQVLEHSNGYTYREIPIIIKGTQIATIKLFNCDKPYRLDGETQQEYRFRTKAIKRFEKNHKKGLLIWDSSSMGELTVEKAYAFHKQLQEQQQAQQEAQ